MRKSIFLLIIIPFWATAQNKKCVELKKTSFSKGVLEWEISNTYDDKGNLVEVKELNQTNNARYESKKTLVYDQKGRLVKESNFLNGNLLYQTEKEYDNRGNLMREVTGNGKSEQAQNRISVVGNAREQLFYEADGKVSGREVQELNAAGKLLKKELRGPENVLYQSTDNTYDQRGQLIKTLRNDVVGNATEGSIYNYDAQGVLRSDSSTYNGKITNYTVYEYANGFLVKKTRYNADQSVDYLINYTNDEKGNVLVEEFIYNNAVLTTLRNTYDINANKIQEDTYNNNNLLVRTLKWEYQCK